MQPETDFPNDLRALEHDYELIREIGQGGMAAVYLARRRDTGALVAIKAIRARYLDDPDALQRFAREARTVADLNHPNIVRTEAIEQIGDRAVAIIMEHIAGGTVRDRLREYGAFDAEYAENVLRDVANALGYAHRRGIVHRDVKPENVFLDRDRGRALLSDFGIARRIEGDVPITLLGAALGTPQYMSPEQVDGARVDGRSDIYSLGVLGWELLTGRRPWAGESLYSVIYKQKHEELPPITALRPRVPANLLFAIERALAKNPERRWQSTDEFLEHLTYNPPPILAQSYPAGAPRVDDEPTVRFRSASSTSSAAPEHARADDVRIDDTRVDDTRVDSRVDSRVDPEPVLAPQALRQIEHLAPERPPAIEDRTTTDRDAERRATQGRADEHRGVVAPDPVARSRRPERSTLSARAASWRPHLTRRLLLRGLGLVVPLAIAGGALYVVFGDGPSAASGPKSAGTMTSSSGSVALDTVSAPNAGTSPSGRTAASPGTPTRTGDIVASPAPRSTDSASGGRAGAARPVDSARPRTDVAGADVVRRDSASASRSAQPKSETPVRQPAPTARTPAPPATPRATTAPPTTPTGAVPSPRCRVASMADQRACLLAYIDQNDVPLQRVYDSLIVELRRIAGTRRGQPDPPGVTRLRVEQRAWIGVRDRECTRRPAPGSVPFWAQPLSECFAEMSASRADELGAALQRVRVK